MLFFFINVVSQTFLSHETPVYLNYMIPTMFFTNVLEYYKITID